MLIDSKLLLPLPTDVIERLVEITKSGELFPVVGFTLSRVALGFFTGLVSGIVLAFIACRFKIAEILLWPYMVTVKSVPVASFVVIALMWISAKELSWLISFLIVLPIIYNNLLEGIRSTDKKLIEMADLFGMPFWRRLKYIRIPAVKPFLMSGCRISLGLAWKSGVAAELIGYPEGSVGEALYFSKLFLDTANLFAWTVAIVIASVIFEKAVIFLFKKITERLTGI